MTKVIVAGGRAFTDEARVRCELLQYKDTVDDMVLEVVCGEARGADTLGRVIAEEQGWPIASFPADWNHHGRAAGPIRNKQMAEYADVLMAFWDGKSKGTKGMIDLALKHKLEVHVYPYE